MIIIYYIYYMIIISYIIINLDFYTDTFKNIIK